ncbi:hypothetical protein QE152_g36283 [Popillia japonica]|uniref:Uncharacterized protein n=1 Tax=Popillia japonica TaxID=7064 RepID=A0AAW1IDJ0_POPJA
MNLLHFLEKLDKSQSVTKLGGASYTNFPNQSDRIKTITKNTEFGLNINTSDAEQKSKQCSIYAEVCTSERYAEKIMDQNIIPNQKINDIISADITQILICNNEDLQTLEEQLNNAEKFNEMRNSLNSVLSKGGPSDITSSGIPW